MPQGIKNGNSYQDTLSKELYEKCPKSVFAAIAVSFSTLITNDGSSLAVENAILDEWKALYENGIVPQKPFK